MKIIKQNKQNEQIFVQDYLFRIVGFTKKAHIFFYFDIWNYMFEIKALRITKKSVKISMNSDR